MDECVRVRLRVRKLVLAGVWRIMRLPAPRKGLRTELRWIGRLCQSGGVIALTGAGGMSVIGCAQAIGQVGDLLMTLQATP